MVIARNPFYLLSAGLLLYGINRLTTDPKLVGAEFTMLQFNFCALIIYEAMLTVTAIALARRRIWYDALLLIGLANVFIIVPFSLISRAVYLDSHLALTMSLAGALLAAGKFWAFKKFIPDLNLPARLLAFGTVLLLANASAPLIFRAIANDSTQTSECLNIVWMFVLPVFACLGNLLPKAVVTNDSFKNKGVPAIAFYFGWIAVTGCHLGGIGYSMTFEWSLPLLVPLLWVSSWTLYLRKSDFQRTPSNILEHVSLFVPLLVPLLATGSRWVLPVFALLNVVCYAWRFAAIDRCRIGLIQLLGAVAILLSAIPAIPASHVVAGVPWNKWTIGCVVLCFFWLIFTSRDARIAFVVVLSCVGLGLYFAGELAPVVIQLGLISLLTHSLRWDDRLQKGAALLRNLSGSLWVILSISWLRELPSAARLPVYIGASVLLIAYGIRAFVSLRWQPRAIPIFIAPVVMFEPVIWGTRGITDVSPGFIDIGGSFLLFAVGCLTAFSKSKRPSAAD